MWTSKIVNKQIVDGNVKVTVSFNDGAGYSYGKDFYCNEQYTFDSLKADVTKELEKINRLQTISDTITVEAVTL